MFRAPPGAPVTLVRRCISAEGDAGVTNTIFTGPMLVAGISSNGNATTHRSKAATIPWADLDEDPNNLDEIAVVVTLTPRLPGPQVAKSALVSVDAP